MPSLRSLIRTLWIISIANCSFVQMTSRKLNPFRRVWNFSPKFPTPHPHTKSPSKIWNALSSPLITLPLSCCFVKLLVLLISTNKLSTMPSLLASTIISSASMPEQVLPSICNKSLLCWNLSKFGHSLLPVIALHIDQFCVSMFEFIFVPTASCTTYIWWWCHSMIGIPHQILLQWSNAFLMHFFQIINKE